MADSQRNLDHSEDASVEQFFDLESYYEGACAEPDGILDSEVQAPNEPRVPSQLPRLELYQDHASSSEAVASMSLNNETAMTDKSFATVGGSPQPATHTINESLHQYEQPSGTDSPNAEMIHIDARLEEIDLILERRELQKRRHTILKSLPEPQQAQASERPGPQILGTASDIWTQPDSQGVTSGDAGQRSDLFATSTVPFNNNRMDHSYNVNISTSGNDPRQNVPGSTDFRYDVAFRDPSNFGCAELSHNAHRGSSHFEVIDQSSKAVSELSNNDSVLLPNYTPTGRPRSGPNDQWGIQGPVPGLGSGQTGMQSSLRESQYRQGLDLDTVQHVSADSSTQHDRALHNSETSMIIRKRRGSPQPTEVQHLSAIQRQLAKKTGVPEISLGVMCFNTDPPPKRRRTSSQKRNKKDVESIGGACFLCLVFKKKCSSQRPCDTCRDYWQKRAHNSTSFMWTCDVQSKLYDINIFSHSLGVLESEPLRTLGERIRNLFVFPGKFSFFFDMMDNLEPMRAKFLGLTSIESHKIGSYLGSYLELYTCTHSIVRWKRHLVYLVPKLHRELAFIETVYRHLTHLALGFCDRMHVGPRGGELGVIVGVLVFDEIKHLTKMEMSDPSAVDHVKLALKARLKVLCSRIFDFGEGTSKGEVPASLVLIINRVPELLSYLPEFCQVYAKRMEASWRGNPPYHIPATPLDLSACLLRRSESSDDYYDDRKTDNCCCGWAFDSTPPFFLSLFGHSARSFARYFHSEPQKISLGDEDLAFDIRQAMNAVLGGPWVDNSSLRESMMVFASVLSFLIWQLVGIGEYAIEELDRHPKMAIIDDRLDRIAEHCRPQYFAHILRSGVAMYHAFWNSGGESEADNRISIEVWNRVCIWALKRQGFEKEAMARLVFGNLISTTSVETTESDNPDLSSDENGTQDEPEEQ